MKPNRNSREKKPSIRLFHFTEREERMMKRAVLLSSKFMESYGKGATPTWWTSGITKTKITKQ